MRTRQHYLAMHVVQSNSKFLLYRNGIAWFIIYLPCERRYWFPDEMHLYTWLNYLLHPAQKHNIRVTPTKPPPATSFDFSASTSKINVDKMKCVNCCTKWSYITMASSSVCWDISVDRPCCSLCRGSIVPHGIPSLYSWSMYAADRPLL